MCFKGGSESPSTSGDDSSSTMDEAMASARASRKAMSDDDQKAAQTASSRKGPITENEIMREARKSSGTKPSGIIRKSLLSLLY
jgi:hypothetical protein